MGRCGNIRVSGCHRRIAKKCLKSGDVVTIPAEVKHWHGAKKNSWFSHLAVECPGEQTSNEWLEAVDDEHYNKLDEQED